MTIPRFLLRSGWLLHRALIRLTDGRLGLWRPTDRRLGSLLLCTVGHRSGELRRIGLWYLEDGPDLVLVASNAGSDADPAWLWNLRASPLAFAELPGERRRVRARLAEGDERDRWFAEFARRQPTYREYERTTDRPIPVVILEPADDAGPSPGGPVRSRA